MTPITSDFMEYAENCTSKEPAILAELRRETWIKTLNPRMLSGIYQGRLLSILSKIKRPELVLEIGTFTGYATLCLAEGLAENGKIITIDNNDELVDIQRKYFIKSGLANQIQSILGNALDVLDEIQNEYDIVFLDADKSNYLNYFEKIKTQIKGGGILLTDNVLWDGKVLSKATNDHDTEIIKAFNDMLVKDVSFETILLPIRDGLSISVKKY